MSKLKTVIQKVSMIQIPENAILDRIIRELDGREAFSDADSELNEKIYYGSVFETILGEFGELEETPMYPQKKVMEQLEELAELSDCEYIQIIKH